MHFLSNTVVVFCRLRHTIKKELAGGLWVRLHISGVWSSLLYSFNSLSNHKSASPEQISNTDAGKFNKMFQQLPDILCLEIFCAVICFMIKSVC